MKNYPKIEDENHVFYVKYPVQRKSGKWVCADVTQSGYLDLPNNAEHNTEEAAQKACDIHNRYHRWTDKEVNKIIAWSMGLDKEGVEEKLGEALGWITSGKKDSVITWNGQDAFIGCLERFNDNRQVFGDQSKSDIAIFCKKEADDWYQGFDDDSLENRKNFAASLFYRIQSQKV